MEAKVTTVSSLNGAAVVPVTQRATGLLHPPGLTFAANALPDGMALRSQMAMIANNPPQKAILGDADAATIEAALVDLEAAASAYEAKLSPSA